MEPMSADELLLLWYRDRPCWDCNVALRDYHAEGCDVARCLFTGHQRLGCDGDDHDCGDAVHDGYWPGEKECAVLGWVMQYGTTVQPDVNRLLTDAQWNRRTGWWEPKSGMEFGTPDADIEWSIPGGLVVKTTERSERVVIAGLLGDVEVKRGALAELCEQLTRTAVHPKPVRLRLNGSDIVIAYNQLEPLIEILWKLHQRPLTGVGSGAAPGSRPLGSLARRTEE